jgi:hypothetical protein
MNNLRANIRNHITVSGSAISFNTIYPLQLVSRQQDGYMWVELYDTTLADHDEAKLIGDSGVFGDTYSGKGCDAASIREKAAILVEASKYYAGA